MVLDRLSLVAQEGKMGHLRPVLATRYAPHRALVRFSNQFLSIEFSEVRQDLSKDNSFEGCVDLREREIIPVGKANSLGEARKETILWHGT